MIKTKSKKQSKYLPLVVTGYILFLILVISVLMSTTIPMGVMLFSPHVLHYNVATFAVALTVGALLPMLVGYFVGDGAVKSKDKLRHHFNGVLFGLLAYWLMTLPVLIGLPEGVFQGAPAMRAIVLNIIPSVVIGVVTLILAVMHLRSRQAKQDIVEYKPFSVVLIGAVILLQVWSVIIGIATNSIDAYSFVLPVITFVLGVISYVSLRSTKLARYSKATWAAVSVSVVFVSAYVFSMFVHGVATYLTPSTMESQAIVSGVGAILALVTWVVYWARQSRVL